MEFGQLRARNWLLVMAYVISSIFGMGILVKGMECLHYYEMSICAFFFSLSKCTGTHKLTEVKNMTHSSRFATQ